MAYRNMEMKREFISFTFDPKTMLFPLQMGFGFIRAAVASSILKTSGLEPSTETTAQRYLKLVKLPSFCLFIFISLDAIGAVCHQFCLRGTDFHLIPCAGFVETFY